MGVFGVGAALSLSGASGNGRQVTSRTRLLHLLQGLEKNLWTCSPPSENPRMAAISLRFRGRSDFPRQDLFRERHFWGHGSAMHQA